MATRKYKENFEKEKFSQTKPVINGKITPISKSLKNFALEKLNYAKFSKPLPPHSNSAYPLTHLGEVNKTLVVGIVAILAIIALVILLFFAQRFVGKAIQTTPLGEIEVNHAGVFLVPGSNTVNVGEEIRLPVETNINDKKTVAVGFKMVLPAGVPCPRVTGVMWIEAEDTFEEKTCTDEGDRKVINYYKATLNPFVFKTGSFRIANIIFDADNTIPVGTYTLDFTSFIVDLDTEQQITLTDVDPTIIVQDLCARITCQNAGTCNRDNGQCQCLPAFTGDRCQTPVTCDAGEWSCTDATHRAQCNDAGTAYDLNSENCAVAGKICAVNQCVFAPCTNADYELGTFGACQSDTKECGPGGSQTAPIRKKVTSTCQGGVTEAEANADAVLGAALRKTRDCDLGIAACGAPNTVCSATGQCVPPETPICTNDDFSIEEWGACNVQCGAGGIQTRTVTNNVVCRDGTVPSSTQPCDPVPSCANPADSCVANRCVPPGRVCTPGVTECVGGTSTKTCNVDGMAWTTTPCATGKCYENKCTLAFSVGDRIRADELQPDGNVYNTLVTALAAIPEDFKIFTTLYTTGGPILIFESRLVDGLANVGNTIVVSTDSAGKDVVRKKVVIWDTFNLTIQELTLNHPLEYSYIPD